MPQFDTLSFFNQLFWLSVLFNSFYVTLIKHYFTKFVELTKIRIKLLKFYSKIKELIETIFTIFFFKFFNKKNFFLDESYFSILKFFKFLRNPSVGIIAHPLAFSVNFLKN